MSTLIYGAAQQMKRGCGPATSFFLFSNCVTRAWAPFHAIRRAHPEKAKRQTLRTETASDERKRVDALPEDLWVLPPRNARKRARQEWNLRPPA